MNKRSMVMLYLSVVLQSNRCDVEGYFEQDGDRDGGVILFEMERAPASVEQAC